jgi:hypothetical protein
MVVGMEIAAVVERIEHIGAVRANPVADTKMIASGLVAIREARAWLDAQQANLVHALQQVDSFPEKTVADATKQSLGHAARTTERSVTIHSTPNLAEALEAGAITVEHLDAVTRTSKQLDGAQRAELIERADTLAHVATAATVDEFARRLTLEAKRLQEDDGMDRLARQRRNTRARSWIDADGMWNLTAKFDPLTGVKIAARIDAMVQSLFAQAVPADCPTDPFEKQRYLAAHAITQLLLNTGSSTGSLPGASRPAPPEFVVVIDADAPNHPGPVAEFTIPVEIPAQVLAALAGTANIHAVIIRNGVVLHAPGNLNLGRTTRLANRAQRRALRALYPHCAINGCTVSFDHCNIHYIIWWRHNGTTDLNNLIPVCSTHHTNIHHHGWHITLGPHRELTLRLPDSTTHTTKPPTRQPTEPTPQQQSTGPPTRQPAA